MALTHSSGAGNSPRVLLVLMPWAGPNFPGLGPALLGAILNEQGIPCDLRYGNLLFHKLMRRNPAYACVATWPLAEIAFTPSYFDVPPRVAARQLHTYASAPSGINDAPDLHAFMQLVNGASTCVQMLFDEIAWDRYDIIGFSVMMQQTVPSLALAKRIKHVYPNKLVVFGGPNCSSPMGNELIRCFPEVDFVLEGEADRSLVQLVRELRYPGLSHYTTAGLRYRDANGHVRNTASPPPFYDLDSLPPPDYEPYFQQVTDLGLVELKTYLQMETARGCWWGEKHHCSFCSLEDILMKYRTKSEDTVIKEVLYLAEKYGHTDFFPSDSILNHRFYKTFLPRLHQLRQEEDYDFTFFFEAKSNIRPDHAQRLRDAGVNQVQVGLESFSDHILQLMNKGTTGIRQIQCLKLLAEYGIRVIWNLIYRNPNEVAADYREMIDLLPSLYHLPPLADDAFIPMQLMRFSPYFLNPATHGITNIRPADFNRHLFPRSDIDLSKLAFYFDYDHEDHNNTELHALYFEMREALYRWRRYYREHALIQMRGPNIVTIWDRRVLPEHHVADERCIKINGVEAEIFVFCNQVRSESEIFHTFDGCITIPDIRLFLDDMVRQRFMYRSRSAQILSLPLSLETREGMPHWSSEAVGSAWVGDHCAGKASLCIQLPGEVDAPYRMIEELVEAIHQDESAIFDLGEVDFNRSGTLTLLATLARIRREHQLGFALSCQVLSPVTRKQAVLLHRAGVRQARMGDLIADIVRGQPRIGLPSDLCRLQIVRQLYTVGIEVQWSVVHVCHQGIDCDCRERCRFYSNVQHLPPPDAIISRNCSIFLANPHDAWHHPHHIVGSSLTNKAWQNQYPETPSTCVCFLALAQAIEQWQRTYHPKALTYARGPGFIRICDRRVTEEQPIFIVLRGVAADILFLTQEECSFTSLKRALSSTSTKMLRQTLNQLLEQKLIVRTRSNSYLSLPVRRQFEDHWITLGM